MASARNIRRTHGEVPSEQGAAAGRRDRGVRSDLHERLIAGVPARIMRPRLVFICCLVAIVCFGLLMVYSASAVEALKEEGSSTHFLLRQAVFVGLGGVGALLVALGFPFDLQRFRSGGARFLLMGVGLLLLLVLLVGVAGGGATRWIALGFFTLQPSEFAKPVIILVAAQALSEYFEERSIDGSQLGLQLGFGVAAPLALILAEPDFGTTLIIGATVVGMACLAGLSTKIIFRVGLVFAVFAAAAVIAEPYRMARFFAASDPWADPYGKGYQAVLAIMAFASGGLFGRGIGNATMKYSYLPEAHNDYILAIIGEELGFVGTVVFFAVFLALVLAGLKIAMRSPTLQGRLVASGCSCILMVQFFVNALGILSVTPMTGKPLPFISYGGSSIWASLILAGLIMRVSLESNVETEHDARRSSLAVADESTAGEAQPRSARVSRGGFSVYEGGASAGASGAGYMPLPRPRVRTRSSEAPAGGMRGDPSRRSSGRGTRDASGTRSRSGSGSRAGGSSAASSWRGRAGGSSGGAGGWERVDLGPSAHDRLRGGGSSRRYNGGDGGSARGGSRPRSPRRDG